MHSSTSSSDVAVEQAHGAAEANTYWVKPLPERRVPRVAWRTAAGTALALFVCALGTWEWRMRSLGLEAGDLGATRGAWVAARRRIDAGDVPLAIMGSSRVLFGTSLNDFEQIAGVRPLQLAMQGSSTRRFMANIAADADFKGLLIVDTTPLNFYRSGGGLFDGVLDHYRDQSLSQRSDHWLDQRLQRHFAYLDADYRLLKLIERESRLAERDGVGGPYRTVWKVAETYEDRQTYTWDRLQHDERLRAHAIAVWRANMKRPPALSPAEFAAVIAATRADVEKIRARGGDVVFVRNRSHAPKRGIDCCTKRVPEGFTSPITRRRWHSTASRNHIFRTRMRSFSHVHTLSSCVRSALRVEPRLRAMFGLARRVSWRKRAH
jgi:hypothetical protein